MPLSLKISPLILVFLFSAGLPAMAQGDKSLYKIGLLLADDRKENGADVLSAVTDAFVAARRFKMVERKQLNAMFTEKDLQEFIGGKVNNKLSDVLGLDLVGVVDFTIERTPEQKPQTAWIIEVRLMDVKTAAIFATLTSNRPSLLPPSTPRDAGKNLFQSIREAFPPIGYIIQISGKKVTIDLGSEAGLKEGDPLEIVQEGEQIIHPVTGQVLQGPMKVVGELKVVTVTPQLSTCKVKEMHGKLHLGSLVQLQQKSSVMLQWLTKIPILNRMIKDSKKDIKDLKNRFQWSEPNVTIEVRSLVQKPKHLASAEPDLYIAWSAPPGSQQNMRIRASSFKPRTYLCVDTTVPAARGSYRWPVDTFGVLGLGQEDLGLIAWLVLPGPAGTTRTIYLPLRVGTGATATAKVGYQIALIPSERLNEARISISRLDTQANIVETLRRNVELGYGYYPANKPTVFSTGPLGPAGFYRITVTAIPQSGLSAEQDFDLYHSGD